MTVEIPTPDPPLARPVMASRSLPGGSLLVSALAQYSMSADKWGWPNVEAPIPLEGHGQVIGHGHGGENLAVQLEGADARAADAAKVFESEDASPFVLVAEIERRP